MTCKVLGASILLRKAYANVPLSGSGVTVPLESDWAAAWRNRLAAARVVATLRASSPAIALRLAQVAVAGGLRWLDLAWTSGGVSLAEQDRPGEMIAQLRSQFPQCQIGAASVLNVGQLREAIAAGAQFAFTPHGDRALIHTARDRGFPLVAGALTPTEILSAWQAGATAIKVFPISAVGGAAYLQALRPVLGGVPLVASGGVSGEQVPALLAAGAIAVAMGSGLFAPSQTDDSSAVSAPLSHLLTSLSEGSLSL